MRLNCVHARFSRRLFVCHVFSLSFVLIASLSCFFFDFFFSSVTYFDMYIHKAQCNCILSICTQCSFLCLELSHGFLSLFFHSLYIFFCMGCCVYEMNQVCAYKFLVYYFWNISNLFKWNNEIFDALHMQPIVTLQSFTLDAQLDFSRERQIHTFNTIFGSTDSK